MVIIAFAFAITSAAVIVVPVPAPIVTIVAACVGRLPHINARSGSVSALRDGIVDANPAPVNLHAGALVLGHFGVVHRLEVHEAETARTARLSVNYD